MYRKKRRLSQKIEIKIKYIKEDVTKYKKYKYNL